MFKYQLPALSLASILVIGAANIASAEIYKTKSNQVVITDLFPKTKYKLKTLSYQDREGTRTLTTNACGVALVSNGTGYKRLTFLTQTFNPQELPLKEYVRCKVRKKK